MAIRQRKKPEEPIDWNEYKSMSFTRAVSNLNQLQAPCYLFYFMFSNTMKICYEHYFCNAGDF